MTPSLRHALVRLALLAAEVCWLLTLLLVLGRAVEGPAGSFPPLWLAAVLPASSGLLLLLRASLSGGRLRRATAYVSWAVGGGLLLLAVQAVSPGTPYLVLPAVAALWAVGLHPALVPPNLAAAVRQLQLSVLVLLVILVTAFGFHIEPPGMEVGAVASVVFGLLATALANERGPLGSLGAGRWWGVLLAGLVGVGLLGLVVTAVVTPEVLRALGQAAGWVWSRIDWVLGRVSDILPDPGAGGGSAAPSPGAGGGPDQDMGAVLPDWLLQAVRLAFSIFVLACGAAAVWLLSRRLLLFARRRFQEGGTEVESIQGAFRADLTAAWRGFLTRLRAWFKRPLAPPPAVAVSAEPPEIVRVRQLYRRLLQLGAQKGAARKPWQTPGEYRQALAALWEGEGDCLDLLTNRYVEARYGGRGPSPQDLEKLDQVWRSWQSS